MKKSIFIFIGFLVMMSSCGTHKRITSSPSSRSGKNVKTVSKSANKKINAVIDYAKSFRGTKYKYGGTTKKGMDCSGLVYTSFKKEDIVLPRTSRSMSVQGKKVALNKVALGDLIFFRTNKNKNVINHVGIVVGTGSAVRFIHASTSRGVIVSSLSERYWKDCFMGVRRVL